jgi:hypothetical protein
VVGVSRAMLIFELSGIAFALEAVVSWDRPS